MTSENEVIDASPPLLPLQGRTCSSTEGSSQYIPSSYEILQGLQRSHSQGDPHLVPDRSDIRVQAFWFDAGQSDALLIRCTTDL